MHAVSKSSNASKDFAWVADRIAKTIGDLGLRPERRTVLSSCFISYSCSDTDFAAYLGASLQEVGVRCWLDSKELKVGDNIAGRIHRAIQSHDKVLPILSRSSVQSPWVRAEIRAALAPELARNNTVVFPIRLDDAVFDTAGARELDRLKDRIIIDFSGWRNTEQYHKAS